MKKFCKLISYIFQPLLMPTYGIALLMQTAVFAFLPVSFRLIAVIGTLLFTGILPALPIYLMMKKGQIRDLFISKREERTMPYMFSMLSYVFWMLFLWRTLRFPVEFVLLAAGSVLSVFIMIFINLRWKISAHLAGAGGIFGGILGVSYIMAINPFWLIITFVIISGLVAISRVYLKAHTLSQVIAGFLLGFVSVLLPVILYNIFFTNPGY